MLKNWGLKELAEHEYKESIDEMKHADRLTERILFLDGLPNFQALGKLQHRREPEGSAGVRPGAGDGGDAAAARPRSRIAKQVGDYVSRELFTDILESEEEHIDWLETQLALIARIGEQNYLQTKIDGDSD